MPRARISFPPRPGHDIIGTAAQKIREAIAISLLIYLVSGAAAGVLCARIAARLSGTRRKTAAGAFACALLFAAGGMKIGFAPHFLPIYALAALFVCVSLCDFEKRIIPNELVLTGAALAVLHIGGSYLSGAGLITWDKALLGALCGAVPILLLDRAALILLKRDGFGYGDAKLAAVCGLFLGVPGTFFSLMLAFVICGALAALLCAFKKINRNDYVAFGPFICAGAYIWLLFGNDVASWYAEILL